MAATLVVDHPESLAVRAVSVDEYHRMIDGGILEEGEPIELLDGLLVRKDRGGAMVVNPRHRLVVHRLLGVSSELGRLGCHLELQSPITIAPSHEPEPDAMVVQGAADDYADRHPAPADVWSVVEVAASSLVRDRTTKLRIYAGAAIPQYVVIDLVHDQIEVHEDPDPREPRYRRVQTLGRGDVLELRAGPEARVTIAVASLLG